MLNLLVLAVALSCASTPEQALDLGSSGMRTLSGDWSGTVKMRQAGTCKIGFWRDQKLQTSSVLEEKVRIRLAVDPDGAFTGREYVADVAETESLEWRGTLGDALRVTAARSSQAACQGEESEIKTQLEGRVVQGPDGPTLKLSGREETCPKMKCIFTLTYRLVKKG